MARKAGVLVIGTDLETKKFEEKLAKLEAKYSKEQIDLTVKTSSLNKAKGELNDAKKSLKEIQGELKKVNELLEPKQKQYNKINDLINSGQAVQPSQYLAHGRLENEITALSEKQAQLTAEADKYSASVEKATTNLVKAQAQYDKQLIKVQDTGREIDNVKKKLDSLRFGNITGSIKQVGASMSNVLKKVAKWSLAVIGIRSVYLGIRSAMNTLMQYDSQLQANVDYLRYALANSLKPVIEWIINAIYEILGLVGGLIKIATGYNIFKNSGIKDYQKAIKSANKSTKELKKTLAGFDEMNVLQDNSDSGAGGGGVSGMPNLGDLADKVEEYAKKTNKAIDGMVDKWFKAGADLKKALDDPEMFTKAYGHWDKFFEGIVQVTYGAWEIITGIFETVGGLMDMLVGVFTGDWELIKSGFKFFTDGILNILSGVLDIAAGLLKMAFGLIKGLLGDLWVGIKQLCKAGWDYIKELAKSGWEFIKGIFVGVANWFDKNVITPVKNFFSGLWTGVKNTASGAWTSIKNIFSSVATWFKEKVTEPIHQFFKDAIDKVKNLFVNLWNKVEEIVNKIKNALSGITDKISNAKDKVGNFFSNAGKGVKDFFGFQKGGIAYYKKGGVIPLASGAVINQPGRGVPITTAIGGEHGAEGIIPLTDSQQMALLGEAIGRYITITANITNTMNGRVISKELQKINNENDFAYNR